MNECSSLLICHLSVHLYGSIHNNDYKEQEGINEWESELLPPIKDMEFDNNNGAGPPFSLAAQWDELEKFDIEDLVASHFCNHNIDIGNAWPITLAVMTIGIPDFLPSASFFMLLYVHFLMKT